MSRGTFVTDLGQGRSHVEYAVASYSSNGNAIFVHDANHEEDWYETPEEAAKARISYYRPDSELFIVKRTISPLEILENSAELIQAVKKS